MKTWQWLLNANYILDVDRRDHQPGAAVATFRLLQDWNKSSFTEALLLLVSATNIESRRSIVKAPFSTELDGKNISKDHQGLGPGQRVSDVVIDVSNAPHLIWLLESPACPSHKQNVCWPGAALALPHLISSQCSVVGLMGLTSTKRHIS